MGSVLVAGPHRLCYLAGNVSGVPFIYDVQKRGELGALLVVAVHSAVNGDKANAQLRESHFCIHSHFKVITAKPGKVFHHNAIYPLGFYIVYHTLKIRTVEVRAAIAIVYVFIDHKQAVLLSVAAQHHALSGNRIAFPGSFIVSGQTKIQSGVIYGLFHNNYPPSRNSPRTCDALSNKVIISQVRGIFNLFVPFSGLFL